MCLFLQEACGFKTTGERTQVYRLDPDKHDDVCLAGTSEMPLAGINKFGFIILTVIKTSTPGSFITTVG